MTPKYLLLVDPAIYDEDLLKAIAGEIIKWPALTHIVGVDTVDGLDRVGFIKSITKNTRLQKQATELTYPDEATAFADLNPHIANGHHFHTYDKKTFYTSSVITSSVATVVTDKTPNSFSRVFPTGTTNIGLERIQHRSFRRSKEVRTLRNGRGTDVYVLDNGIQLDHPEIKESLENGLVFDCFREESDPLYGYPDSDDHGTHVASVIAGTNYGVAFGATIIPVKVISEVADSSLDGVVSAVNWILEKKAERARPSVVNMSFISEEPEAKGIFETLFTALIEANIIPVVSAGNQSRDAFYLTPANAGSTRNISEKDGVYSLHTAFDNAIKPIVVSATDSDDNIVPTANYGDIIDIFAPGSRIYGASITGYTEKTGTSMAAPFVTGVIAMMLEDGEKTIDEVRSYLSQTSTKFAIPVEQTYHERENYEILDANMGKVTISNKLISPNRLLYVWYVATEFEWPVMALSVDENTRTQQAFTITSVEASGEQQLLVYKINDFDAEIESQIKGYAGYVELETINRFRNAMSPLTVDITVPVITKDEKSSYIVEAFDGRLYSYGILKVAIRNVPKPPVWQFPSSGILPGSPVKKDDSISLPTLAFKATHEDDLDITYSVYPADSLPQGLNLTQVDGVAFISGLVERIPAESPLYEFIIRATASNGLVADRYFSFTSQYVNEKHFFNRTWLSSLLPDSNYSNALTLKTGSVGNSYLQLIQIVNPDLDPLTFEVVAMPDVEPTEDVFTGILPVETYVDKNYTLRGIIDPSESPGSYYFRLYVTDPSGYQIYQDFVLPLVEEISSIDDGAQIEWVTPAGNIGFIYETFPSHCLVEARSPTKTPISYALTPGSGTLPPGLHIDPETGEINGITGMIEGASLKYDFSIRASIGSRYVDRAFSIRIVNLFDSDTIMNVRANVTGDQRLELGSYVWGGSVSKEFIFKRSDGYFGAPKQPNLYVVSGLKPNTFNNIVARFNDYERKMDLVVESIESVPVKDPSGIYAYDLVYLKLKDRLENAGGRPTTTSEDVLLKVQKNTFDQNNYNVDTKQTRYFPNNMRNVRNDLISDLGMVGPSEGMPLWMKEKFSLGIAILYAKPGRGPQCVEQLRIAGLQKSIIGHFFEVDRFYIGTMTTRITTQFDVVEGVATTTFDDPDKPSRNNEDLSGFSQPTLFDVVTSEEGRYVKFPLDDKKLLDNRTTNPFRYN